MEGQVRAVPWTAGFVVTKTGAWIAALERSIVGLSKGVARAAEGGCRVCVAGEGRMRQGRTGVRPKPPAGFGLGAVLARETASPAGRLRDLDVGCLSSSDHMDWGAMRCVPHAPGLS